MKNFSNKYIFLYATAIVAVVAVLLSIVATALKPRQQENMRNEKMQNLLAAIDVRDVPAKMAAETYKKYFKTELTVSTSGDIKSCYDISSERLESGNIRAFDINLKEQQALDKGGDPSAVFPVYVFEKDGACGYVLPLRGAGLWGAVWGNIALADDCNTVVGANFDHEGETPGLGAEITTQKFQAPFVGKQILDENGQVVSIAVRKHAAPDSNHEVDAISGGTMTSNGVNAMLETDLKRYQAFFDNIRSQQEEKEVSQPIIEEMEDNHE